MLGEDSAGLQALIDLTSHTGRHDRDVVPLSFPAPLNMPAAVRAAFAFPAPEWQFSDGTVPHIVVADTLRAAITSATERYGQFLRDTEQGPCTLSFVVERYRLTGDFHTITDREVFAPCYNSADFSVAHALVNSLSTEKANGLIYDCLVGETALVLKPACLSGFNTERSVALDWNGAAFERYYDYRDLHWSRLVG